VGRLIIAGKLVEPLDELVIEWGEPLGIRRFRDATPGRSSLPTRWPIGLALVMA
jgi:hypothetical protein